MLSVNVFSLKAYDFKEGGLFYKKTASGEVEVVSETAVFSPLGYYNDGNAPTGRVVVPEEVRHGAVNYRVTSIHELAFNYCSELTFISIPGSVKTITKSTFFSSGLTGISIAEGVEKIEKHAFYFCSKLTSVSIPNSVKIGRAHV